jgi:hypothetical protein
MILLAILSLFPVARVDTSTPACAGNDVDSQFSELVEWVRRSGGFVDERLVLGTQASGLRGIFVAEGSTIAKDEHTFHVPFEMALTVESARLSTLGPLLVELPANTSAHAIVALHLVHQDLFREQSFWKPYLNILPKNANLPLDFPPALQQLLGLSSALLDGVELASQQREVDWLAVQTLLLKHRALFKQESDEQLRARFIWAHNTISMRSWSEMMPTFASAANLIPFADSFNHHTTRGVHIYEHKSGVAFRVPESLQSGAEVFQTYLGKSMAATLKCNACLFKLFGFVVDDDPAHDCYLLQIDFTPPSASDNEAVRLLLAALESTDSSCALSGGTEGEGITKALVRIRLLIALMSAGSKAQSPAASQEGGTSLLSDTIERILRGEPVPNAEEAEARAVRLLSGALSGQLARLRQQRDALKHALEQAVASATAEELYSIHCIQTIVAGEERVLVKTVELVESHVAYWDMRVG